MVLAAVPVVPFGLAGGSLYALTPHLLLLASVLALFSSILPFTLEMHALRTLPARTFSILMSLEPVAAALSGWWLLGEKLTAGQWLAVGCIVLASAGAAYTLRSPTPNAAVEPAI
jgi:inner membrane transporter RhtA